MSRFYHDKPARPFGRICAVVIFIIICSIFYVGLSSISNKAENEQQKTLEDALHRGITQCYAIEGRYPESLEYLIKEYKISYDKEKYFVDYKIVGENIMPNFTVIKK